MTRRTEPIATAIVLARAGSKGLPHKNVLPVAGRPCAMWTIGAARAAACIGRVVLTTDDARLQELARDEGVIVVDRPARLAGDGATVDDAARHALHAAELAADAPASDDGPIVILYANVPVRPPDLIDQAVEMLVATRCDSVQSYAPVGKHHPWWTARVDAADGSVRPFSGEVLNHGVYRRQELPEAYIPDGGVIALTRRALNLGIEGVRPGPHAFLGRDRRGVLTGEGQVVDIDSRIDLLVADAILGDRSAPDAQNPAVPRADVA